TRLTRRLSTPGQRTLQPGSDFCVMSVPRADQPQTASVRPEAEGATAAPRLAPNPVHVDLQAVAPAKKPVAKKRKLVAAVAGPAATGPKASAAPTPAPMSARPALAPTPSAPTEMAPSATNYPWPSR